MKHFSYAIPPHIHGRTLASRLSVLSLFALYVLHSSAHPERHHHPYTHRV